MPELKVKPDDSAPDFQALDDQGAPLRLSDFRGKRHVVLYFYPKDNTPGCTVEARGFNESLAQFQERQTTVLGVSTDSVQSHARFRDSCSLQFRLIADPEKKIAQAYGALRGLTGLLGIASRVTVLIDKKGVVRAVWNSVSPRRHPEEVLQEIDRLGLS